MPSSLAVVDGATLTCTMGAAPSRLTATSFARAEGAALATIADHTAASFSTFGNCLSLCGPCQPMTPVPWSPGATFLSSFVPVLVAESRLPCVQGGLISIRDPGQGSLRLTPGLALAPPFPRPGGAEDDDDDGPSFGPFAALAGVVAVADGPLPFGEAIGGAVLAAGGTYVVASSIAGDDDADDVDDAQRRYEDLDDAYPEDEVAPNRRTRNQPRSNNQSENKVAKRIAGEEDLDASQRQTLHRKISGHNLGERAIRELARDIKAGRIH